jgi:hypothetical protein
MAKRKADDREKEFSYRLYLQDNTLKLHTGHLHDEEHQASRIHTRFIRGLAPPSRDSLGAYKIFFRDDPFTVPPGVLHPKSILDAHASAPERIQKYYDRKILYPHTRVPKTYYKDLENDPIVVSEVLPGETYNMMYGSSTFPAYNKGRIREGVSIGCLGWSFRQKRRFIRKMALIRIMFLLLRSKNIRGAGESYPSIVGRIFCNFGDEYVC